MDIESNEEEEILDFQPLTLKTDKKLVLSREAELVASTITNRRTRIVEYNRGLDAKNTAHRCNMTLGTRQFGNFQYFMTKNKHRDSRVKIINELRDLAQERGFTLVGRVKDKLEKSRMVVRVLSKEETNGLVMIEDDTGKEKMQIRLGTVYVGMIALMEVSWIDGCYKFEMLHDLSQKLENLSEKCLLREPTQAYRMLFLKGSFSKNDSKENIGLKILITELKSLRQVEKNFVNCIVIFGPLLSSKNTALTQGFSELTFEQETTLLLQLIRDQISKISEQIQVIIVPSTQDLTSLYPIPQPKYDINVQVEGKKMRYTSNPGFITVAGVKQNYQINVINTDIMQYIYQNRTGHINRDILLDNLDAYFKQPFYLVNAQDEPFDETNLTKLYNQGKFGDIVVSCSHRDAPFAREVRGRVFVNIGSLGIDHPNNAGQHYMTLVSIYDGEGPVAQRVKVESLKM